MIYPTTPKTEETMNASVYPIKYASKAALETVSGASQRVSDTVSKVAAPTNNMGVTGLGDGSSVIDYDGTELISIKAKGSNGKHELVRIPKPKTGTDQRVGFVDQVSFTIRLSAVIKRDIKPPYAHTNIQWQATDAPARLSSILLHIFGFGITSQRERGVNFYEKSFYIGDGEGLMGAGGQNDTINVQIYGQGAIKANQGWEHRLKDYLEAVGGWMSRIDLAADFYEGQYTPDQAEQDFLAGKMSLTNRKPFAKRDGDWYGDLGKTFYVGKRESGKLLRVYEKGKQLLGSIAFNAMGENHRLNDYKKWTRAEVEWHNTNRILPLEMLIMPGQYLAGAYPALGFLSEVQNRVDTFKKQAVATVERAKAVFKHQFGGWFYALASILTPAEVVGLMREKIPSWASQFEELPALDDERWISWEKEMAMIPF